MSKYRVDRASGYVKCDNCENLADAILTNVTGWNACPVCCFGEADSLTEYMDYFKPGEEAKADMSQVELNGMSWKEYQAANTTEGA